MCLTDARGRVRKLWGGYSPKKFDGEWLKEKRHWLEGHLAGAAVIADTHFSWGKKNLKKVQFCTPKHKAVSLKDKKLNKSNHQLRARVETPFGIIKQKFSALTKPWQEDEVQQDCLVYFAAGVINASKQ